MELDYNLFQFLNGTLHTAFLDNLMPFITKSSHVTNGIIFSFIIYLIYQKGSRRAFIYLILGLVVFAIADSIAYRVLKPLFGRVRPCNPAYFLDGINSLLPHSRLLLEQKSSFSLPSNHAANLFAQATFWGIVYPKWRIFLFIIATIVTYSRLYVGVHYPFDLLYGAVLGSSVAIGVILISRRFIEYPSISR
jgi:undecaprenyl-diphosphatase